MRAEQHANVGDGLAAPQPPIRMVVMSTSEREARDLARGQRIRMLRARRQVSQVELAAEVGLSGSYLSLIEAGRRSATPEVLERLAAALKHPVDYLQTGRGGPDDAEVDLDLRFAEVALRAGDAPTALDRFERAAAAARERGLQEAWLEARWGQARAQEAVGALESAISAYEDLGHEVALPGSLDRTVVWTALCRAYRECGDLARAVEVGEAALSASEPPGANAPVDDATIALASTLVGCYFERGDLTRAHLLARTTLARAEQNGSPVARAAALWNAGLVSESRGDLRTARTYVERALALYSETDNARATALLRVASAWLILREEEPKIADAETLLTKALDDLPAVGSVLDVAYAETELARCRLLRGNWQAAIVLASSVSDRLGQDGPRIEGARAQLLIGDAHVVSGNIEAATESYTRAASALRATGAQRQAASAWRELAENLARLGRSQEALDAYRAASDAAGIAKAPYGVESIKRNSPEAPVEKAVVASSLHLP